MLLAHLKSEEILFWLSFTALILKTTLIYKQCFTNNSLIKCKIFHYDVRKSSYILLAEVFFAPCMGSLGNLEEMWFY